MKKAEKLQIMSTLFSTYYEALYESPHILEIADAPTMMQAACSSDKKFAKFFHDFEIERKDHITSDREYAAYMLAYSDAEKVFRKIERWERKRAATRQKYREQYGAFVGDVLYLNSLNN